MMLKKISLLLFFVTLSPTFLKAEITKTTIKVDNVTCSYCIKSLQKAFAQLKNKALKSIENRNIDLQKKQLTLNLNSGNSLTFDDLEKTYESTINNAGYKFASITQLEALGTIKHDDFGYYFNVDITNDKIYLLEPFTEQDTTPAPVKKKWWQRMMFWQGTPEPQEVPSTNPLKNRITKLAQKRSLLRMSAPVHRHPDNTYGVSNYNLLKIFMA